jgi:anti-sigma regulatory factor (Ser/Thr protein kinase)
MGAVGGAPHRFTISVPARAELVGTLRMFASAVARHYDLPDDVVEDLKLAVSEASTAPVDAGAGGDIGLSIVARVAGVSCEVSSRSWTSPGVPLRTDLPEGIDPAVLDRLQIVRALFPDAARSERDGVVTVAFSTASRGVG